MLQAAHIPVVPAVPVDVQPLQQAQPPPNAANIAVGPHPRAGGQPAIAINASLSNAPRTLHALWEEWQFGIGGRKPARLFTVHESGVASHKSTFSRRKAFWELMEYLIRSGHTHDEACARIYQVYGENRPVSYILGQIIMHRKHNTSPLMRYG